MKTNTESFWDTHGGYVPGRPNMTELLAVVSGYEDSYNEIIDNKNKFTSHSHNDGYIKSGPLRECITAHLIDNFKKKI